jgi:hypothetical protein
MFEQSIAAAGWGKNTESVHVTAQLVVGMESEHIKNTMY